MHSKSLHPTTLQPYAPPRSRMKQVMARREDDFNDSTSRLIRVKEAAAVAFQKKQVRGGGWWFGTRRTMFV